MKQIISFKKDIPFNTKIGEITSISLEHNLKMVEADHIAGEFIVGGDYKITDISINREPFSYNLPFDITLDTKYNAGKAKIDIDDFYYEIVNNQIMNVNIDILIDGIEVINEFNNEKEGFKMNDRVVEVQHMSDEIEELEELEKDFSDVRSSINDINEVDDREIMDLFKEIETPPIDIKIENTNVADEKIKSLFDTFDDKSETFTTYHVHIVRENDTIDSIAMKYKTTKEEIAVYNKIDELKLGDKIIVAAITNE